LHWADQNITFFGDSWKLDPSYFYVALVSVPLFIWFWYFDGLKWRLSDELEMPIDILMLCCPVISYSKVMAAMAWDTLGHAFASQEAPIADEQFRKLCQAASGNLRKSWCLAGEK